MKPSPSSSSSLRARLGALAWVAVLALGLRAAPALASAAASAPPPSGAPAPGDWALADPADPAAAACWAVDEDHNGLGTVVEPTPFTLTPAGPDGRACARVHGHLGLNQSPWTWAQLRLNLAASGASQDLRPYRSLRFWARGDGRVYQVRLLKRSVTDSDHYGMDFLATGRWTLVELPLDGFRQNGWGKAVPRVFDDVPALDFSPAAHDADFDLSVAGVVLSREPVHRRPRRVDTRGWWPYPGVDPAARAGSALDASFLDDGPAGRHGRVETQGEDFAFDDGTPARFFGVNLVASCNFPTHAQAEAMAQLLAEMGVNLTRHHHLEAVWSDRNIFGSDTQTLKLDPGNLDRFDYLVAALQKRGIYQYFDLLVSRHPLAADGVADPADLADGWKVLAEFAPDLLPLEDRFVSQFLGHRNPYTGRRYADDPGVAMMEVINEDSLFYRGSSGDFSARGAYAKDLQSAFNAWIRGHYPSRKALAKAWEPSRGDAGAGLAPDEDPWGAGGGTARPVASWQDQTWRTLSAARGADEQRFNYDTETGYYRRMIGLLRSLGYRGLVAGSNHWTAAPGDLLANASLGTYVDRHAYYAHPVGGWGYDPAVRFDPSPMLRSAGLGIIGDLAERRVRGLPYLVGEWQCAAPNATRADAVLDMAAACDLQDWSAIQFAFRHSSREDLAHFGGPLDNNFDVANQPAMLALWPAAAILARRGDLPKAQAQDWAGWTRDQALAPGAQLTSPGRAALSVECGVDFEGGAPAPASPTVSGAWSVGDGGMLRHDPSRGVLLLDTPGTQAVAGFLRGVAEHPAGLKAALSNDYAVVVATALDTNRLSSARRILLSAAADAVNSGMSLEPSGDQLASKGGLPVLVEPVVGTVWLALPRTQGARVWALDPSGRRRSRAASERVKDGLLLRLRPQDRALNYEIDLPAAGAF